MLSDDTKTSIEIFVDLCRETGSIELVQSMGPKAVFDTILGKDGTDPSINENVIANRDEAERYLAGLIGMC